MILLDQQMIIGFNFVMNFKMLENNFIESSEVALKLQSVRITIFDTLDILNTMVLDNYKEILEKMEVKRCSSIQALKSEINSMIANGDILPQINRIEASMSKVGHESCLFTIYKIIALTSLMNSSVERSFFRLNVIKKKTGLENNIRI